MKKIEDISCAVLVGSTRGNSSDFFDSLPTSGTWEVEKFGFFKANPAQTSSYLCVVLKSATDVRTVNVRWGVLGSKIDAESLADVEVAVGDFVTEIRSLYNSLNGSQTAEEQAKACKDMVGKKVTFSVNKASLVLCKDGKTRYRMQQRLATLA